MFDILFDELINVDQIKLTEDLTAREESEMRDQMAVPDCRPMPFDGTIQGWLARIEFWGVINYYHKDPENSWGKKKITKSQFVKRMEKEEINKMFGSWEIKRKGLTKCILRRDYISAKGRKYAEQFIIDIKLRKELR